LVAAPFSDPTNVTNPLFPIDKLSSVVLNGRVDGKAFRTETTLLPETRIIEWSPGQCVKTLVSQYVAYLDGRLQEVALDFYAQADDGSLWCFGEDDQDRWPDRAGPARTGHRRHGGPGAARRRHLLGQHLRARLQRVPHRSRR
jgi:hypothetical protein